MKITYDEREQYVTKMKVCCADMYHGIFVAKNIDIVGTIVLVTPKHQEFGNDKLDIEFCPFCGKELKFKIINEV